MILGMPAARILYLAVFLEGIFVFGTFPYLAPVLQARGLGSGGGASLEAGLAVAAFGAGGFVYAAMARPLLGRIGQSRMVRLGGGLAAAALLGFAFAPLATVFIAAGLVLGTGFYMIHNSIQTRVTEVAPEARGSAVALHAFHFFGGQSFGPVLVGLAIGGFGAPAAFVLAAAGILALSVRLGRRKLKTAGPVARAGRFGWRWCVQAALRCCSSFSVAAILSVRSMAASSAARRSIACS